MATIVPALSAPGSTAAVESVPRRFEAPESAKTERLDRFLAQCLAKDGISREKAKRLILEGGVTLNGELCLTPRETVAPGGVVVATVPQARTALAPESGGIDVVYEDAALAVINKPAGLAVHPAPGKPSGTLAHRLVAHFSALAGLEGMRPGIVHRLDKDTSGLMIVALTEKARLTLSGMFARHEVYKAYLALVWGVPEKAEEIICAPIGRHPTLKTKMTVLSGGKSAKSHRTTLVADDLGRFSLQLIRIFSGRTHQVRVHMQHVGHPLVGDALYSGPPFAERGGRRKQKGAGAERADRFFGGAAPVVPRQMLHAHKLAFMHPDADAAHEGKAAPITSEIFATKRENGCAAEGTLAFVSPPPPDFAEAVRALSRRLLPVVLTGSPGCGKSAVLEIMRGKDIPVFSADAEVARQYQPGGDGQKLLFNRFGERFVPRAGAAVDKAALAKAMGDDPSLKREVEGLLHPLVWHAMERFFIESEERGHPVAVAEVPLYFEGERKGMTAFLPVTAGVYASFDERKKRLVEKRGWSAETVAMMESWQWPEEKKMAACDLVLDNSGALEQLSAGVEALLASLHQEKEKREETRVALFAEKWSGVASR